MGVEAGTQRGVLRRTGMCALFLGPLGRGEAGSDQPRQGARAGSARVFAGTRTYRRKPRPRLTHPERRMRGGRGRGVSFLLPTSLWTSKEK